MFLGLLCLIGLSKERLEGANRIVYISLAEAVRSASTIVHAEYVESKPGYVVYDVITTLSGKSIKPKTRIRIETHEEEERGKMESEKLFIPNAYQPRGMTTEQREGQPVVLFLREKSSTGFYRCSSWPGYTGLSDSPKIQKLLSQKPK